MMPNNTRVVLFGIGHCDGCECWHVYCSIDGVRHQSEIDYSTQDEAIEAARRDRAEWIARAQADPNVTVIVA